MSAFATTSNCTSTVAEAVLSRLVGLETIDETNTMILRKYANIAAEQGINAVAFFTDLYVYAEEDFVEDGINYVGSLDKLDDIVDRIFRAAA